MYTYGCAQGREVFYSVKYFITPHLNKIECIFHVSLPPHPRPLLLQYILKQKTNIPNMI